MENETSRQAYIRLLQARADKIDSFSAPQRDTVLVSELIRDGCLEGDVTTNHDGFPVQTITFGMKPKGRLLLQQLIKEELDNSSISQHREGFKSIDRRHIAAMDDKALAAWQSQFKQDEPEWRIGEHEWQRRITALQIRHGRWAIAFTLIGVVVGAVLTRSLSAWHPNDKKPQSIPATTIPITTIPATTVPAQTNQSKQP